MSETSDERAKRIIADCDEFADFVFLTDGKIYYYRDMGDPMTSFDLRVIADELDRRNAARKEHKQ